MYGWTPSELIQMACEKKHVLVWFMVFNATFNNISAISWRSVLLVEETRVHRKWKKKKKTVGIQR